MPLHSGGKLGNLAVVRSPAWVTIWLQRLTVATGYDSYVAMITVLLCLLVALALPKNSNV